MQHEGVGGYDGTPRKWLGNGGEQCNTRSTEGRLKKIGRGDVEMRRKKKDKERKR